MTFLPSFLPSFLPASPSRRPKTPAPDPLARLLVSRLAPVPSLRPTYYSVVVAPSTYRRGLLAARVRLELSHTSRPRPWSGRTVRCSTARTFSGHGCFSRCSRAWTELCLLSVRLARTRWRPGHTVARRRPRKPQLRLRRSACSAPCRDRVWTTGFTHTQAQRRKRGTRAVQPQPRARGQLTTVNASI